MNDTQSLAFWTVLLSITGFRVTSHRETSDAHHFSLAPDDVSCCPDCGNACQRVQKRKAKKAIADLAILGKRVWLRLRRDQYECSHCRHRFTPSANFVMPGTWFTWRLMKHAAEMIRYSDVASAARQLSLPERTLGRNYNHFLEWFVDTPAIPPADREPIKAVGIDELALKKRHRQFVAVIIDHTNGCVLEVLESRKKEHVKACLQRLSDNGWLDELEEVSCDMWEGYANAAREVLGDTVKVCVDRFHVMKAFQDQLTKARREIQRELTKEEAKELKGSRWWWVTNWENLSAVSRKALAALKRRFPRLGSLHDQREKLRAIFEKPLTVESGRYCLTRWIKEAKKLKLKALDAFCGTMERWMDEIVQYFYRRTTNGRTEGFNRGLRSILWRACGMDNFANFRLRVLHAFGPGRTETEIKTTKNCS